MPISLPLIPGPPVPKRVTGERFEDRGVLWMCTGAPRAERIERGFAPVEPAVDAALRWVLRDGSCACAAGRETDREIARALAQEVKARTSCALEAHSEVPAVRVSVGRTALSASGARTVEGRLSVLLTDDAGDVLYRATDDGPRPLAFLYPVH